MAGIGPDTPILGGLFGQPQGGSDGPYVEFYQNMADGTHLVRQSLDPTTRKMVGQATDEGVIAAKTAPTDKPVVKTLSDGSTWAFKFNSDGTVAQSTELAQAQAKPGQQSLDTLRSAQTDVYRQKLADAEAMAPYAPQKAAAQIQLLQAQAAKDTQLLPDQKALIEARVSRIASQNAVDTSRIGLNNANAGKAGAQTDLYTAEAQAKLKSSFFQAKNEADQIQATVGTPDGPTQDQADALIQQVYTRAAQEAATGISATQEATNQLTVQRQAVDQADSRNTAALDYAKSLANLPAEAGAKGAFAGGALMADLLKLGPGYSASQGGGAVNLQQPGGFLGNMGASQLNQPVPMSALVQMNALRAAGVDPITAVHAVGAGNGVPTHLYQPVPGTTGGSGPSGQVEAAPGMNAADVQAQEALAAMGSTGILPPGFTPPPVSPNAAGGFLSKLGQAPTLAAAGNGGL